MIKIQILVLSAGRRVELIQAFQSAATKLLPDARVLATDVKPQTSAACQVADASFAVPRATDPAYIDAILALCVREQVGLVVPTIDTELLVLSQHRTRFVEAGIHLVISEVALVAACRDKRTTSSLYQQLGIAEPRIFNRDAIEFPAFCKPYDGSCSIGARALPAEQDLTPDLLADPRNMFMELVDSRYREYTVDAYYDRFGTMRCLVPRERLEVRGGEVSKGMTRRHFIYEYLKPKAEQLSGARGCITWQVFGDPETSDVKALEINPRFGGGYPLTHAAGADYPAWLIKEYLLALPIADFDTWESDLMMLRYDAKVLVRAQ